MKRGPGGGANGGPFVRSLPAISRAVIGADSQFEPFRKRLGLPHHGAGVCHQNWAMGVAGVVMERGNIRRSQLWRGIGDAPGVPAPYAVNSWMTS